jgi:putative SOS response-associated peptidase YedK
MCGRFTLRTPLNRLVERFLFELHDQVLEPRFNIAPSQPVAVVRQASPDVPRQLGWLKWGLVPSWAKEASVGYKLINARSETVAEKPSFRSAFQHRRCLVIADGYFEWRRVPAAKQKQPFYIHLRDDRPFAFAGLWERWKAADGSPLETCTIVTTDANQLTRSIHPRMPVILNPDHYQRWLTTPPSESRELLECLQAYPSEQMDLFPVSTLVNSPKNESPNCIEPDEDSEDDPPGQRQLSFFIFL